MFPVVHKKLWLGVLRSLHWEIFSQKGIQNTTKCLWWFWSSNTRLQAHYRHCQPLSHVVWQLIEIVKYIQHFAQLYLRILTYMYWYIYYLYIHAIPTDTYKYRQYLLILMYTQIYLSIPWDTCLYMSIPTILILKQPYLCNKWSVWHEPKNSINNRQLPTNGSGWLYILPLCYHMNAYWKLSTKAFFGAPEQW